MCATPEEKRAMQDPLLSTLDPAGFAVRVLKRPHETAALSRGLMAALANTVDALSEMMVHYKAVVRDGGVRPSPRHWHWHWHWSGSAVVRSIPGWLPTPSKPGANRCTSTSAAAEGGSSR
jgi:hypothetical protein